MSLRLETERDLWSLSRLRPLFLILGDLDLSDLDLGDLDLDDLDLGDLNLGDLDLGCLNLGDLDLNLDDLDLWYLECLE